MTRLMAAVLGLCLLFASGAAWGEQIVINQAGPSLTASSIYLADDLGFFKKQGLDVAFISTGSGMKSIVPLVSGSAQFCACIVFHPLQANHSGAADTRLIAGITVGFGTKIILRTAVADRLHLTPDTPLRDRVRMLRGGDVAAGAAIGVVPVRGGPAVPYPFTPTPAQQAIALPGDE